MCAVSFRWYLLYFSRAGLKVGYARFFLCLHVIATGWSGKGISADGSGCKGFLVISQFVDVSEGERG